MDQAAIPEQKDALAAIGLTLLIVQTAERIIKLTMQLVLQKEGEDLTYEKLKSTAEAEARKSMGHFLWQLRQRVEVEANFDSQLKTFLNLRNNLAHNLSDSPDIGFSSHSQIASTIRWTNRLTDLAMHIIHVFAGLIRSWQEQIGMGANLADDELFREIDTVYKPFAEQVFQAKPSKISPE